MVITFANLIEFFHLFFDQVILFSVTGRGRGAGVYPSMHLARDKGHPQTGHQSFHIANTNSHLAGLQQFNCAVQG